MIKYSNLIDSLDIENTDPLYPNKVVNVRGHILAEEESYSSSYPFTEEISFRPDSRPFTPYQQLEESQVFGWVFDKWGEEKFVGIRKLLASRIELMKNPPPQTEALTPPWVK